MTRIVASAGSDNWDLNCAATPFGCGMDLQPATKSTKNRKKYRIKSEKKPQSHEEIEATDKSINPRYTNLHLHESFDPLHK